MSQENPCIVLIPSSRNCALDTTQFKASYRRLEAYSLPQCMGIQIFKNHLTLQVVLCLFMNANLPLGHKRAWVCTGLSSLIQPLFGWHLLILQPRFAVSTEAI